MFSILQLIKEEIQNFYSDWQTDELSLADKVFAKTQPPSTKQDTPIDAELVGYVSKQWEKPLNQAIPVYKNPETLEGFSTDTRGILLKNGDFYVAQNYNALHDNILKLLSEKGIIPEISRHGYEVEYPQEFVAVVRIGKSNTFGQSSAYDYFPPYYTKIFDNGENVQPYGFQSY